ncbi:MAG: UDP-N-acetylmuramoylalanine--D-glutamate ligase [Polaribacter sp.]|jgi:UDP-N-acetylmuramoylalanine--D-glutamate ligase
MKSIMQHKNIIFGLGKSGMSCAHYFDRKEIAYTLIDTRTKLPNKDELSALEYCQASYFGTINEDILDHCEMLIVSPGISLKHSWIREAQKRNIEICGDIELFARECNKKIVAVTGSNGKSTVTELTQKLIFASGLNVQMAGNIGLPVLDYLACDNGQKLPDIFILELSSFQLDLIRSLKADVAVLLNISEDHMDRYDCYNDYVESKRSIFNGAKNKIFNFDDKQCFPSKAEVSDATFSIEKNVIELDCMIAKISKGDSREGRSYDFLLNQKLVLNSKELNIVGKHNYANILASLSILELLNIDLNKNILSTLYGYIGMKHRFQLVSKKFNCHWINDSKATNVGATIAALDNFESSTNQQLILIAGGDSKQSDLTPLIREFEDKVDSLILLGKDAQLFANLSNKIKAYFAKNMLQAIEIAKSLLDGLSNSKQSTVLLSPACASLDMFKNFEDRGDQFIKAIEVLK